MGVQGQDFKADLLGKVRSHLRSTSSIGNSSTAQLIELRQSQPGLSGKQRKRTLCCCLTASHACRE